jgi:hypothetical protein
MSRKKRGLDADVWWYYSIVNALGTSQHVAAQTSNTSQADSRPSQNLNIMIA